MSPRPSCAPRGHDAAGCRDRWRSIGLVRFTCDGRGRVIDAPTRGDDWLADLICHAPITRRAIEEAVRTWRDDTEPARFEAVPGLWIVPIPPASDAESPSRYSLVALPTAALLETEHLDAMCQGVGLDRATARARVASLPPVPDGDIERVAALVRLAHDEHRAAERNSSVIASVSQELAGSYENISFLYKISQSMSVVERPEMFVSILCDELLATIPYAWVAVVLGDHPARLKELAGRFLFRGTPAQPEPTLRGLARELLAGAPGGEAPTGSTMVIEKGTPLYARYGLFGRTSLAQPILSDAGPIGLVIAGDKQGEDSVASSVDMKLLEATAGYTSIFLENRALYDDLNATFVGTLEALTASIDAKDRYTFGHSERVAHLTLELARAAGLDEETVSRTHIAGLVHDVGKIGVPESVLLKPGRLSEAEFAEIRRHPEIGHRILKDIPQFGDILPGVLCHHERWDGRGYPSGLAGADIPILGRLIALADSFDAMSSTRTYRAEMDRADVLAEVRRCAGAQFDPDLAAIFVELDFTGFDRLVAHHRERAQLAAQPASPVNRAVPR